MGFSCAVCFGLFSGYCVFSRVWWVGVDYIVLGGAVVFCGSLDGMWNSFVLIAAVFCGLSIVGLVVGFV